VGQFPEDMELAHLDRLAVTTFPYHHNSTNCVTTAVNSQPLCSELQVHHRVFDCLLLHLLVPMVSYQLILPTVCIPWCADVERSNVIFSLYLLLVAVGRSIHLSCGDCLVLSCDDYSLCRTRALNDCRICITGCLFYGRRDCLSASVMHVESSPWQLASFCNFPAR